MFGFLRDLAPEVPRISRVVGQTMWRTYNYNPVLFWSILFVIIFGVAVFAIGYLGGRAAARDAKRDGSSDAT